MQVPGEAKRYRYDLFPEFRKNRPAEALAVDVDLRRMAGKPVEIKFQLAGIPDRKRGPLKFTVSTTVPMTEKQRVTAAIEAQKVCPVSGQPLGSMGKPIPVTIGKQTYYVCCAGCVDALKENSAKFLGKKPNMKVVHATEADAAAVARQKTCPVMDEPLDAMGGPYKTVVEGQIIYLCCPGCARKLHENPAKYFTKLRDQGVTPPRSQ